MLKQIFILLIGVTIATRGTAQQTHAGINMADYEQLKKMTPAQLEAYKQKMIKEASTKAAAFADENNLLINKALLPGIDLKPPVKDLKRLQLLPSQPPTRSELVTSLQQSVQQIQKGIPAPRLDEIKQLTTTLPVEKVHEKAIMEFYANDPKGAVLMMMQMAAKAPDSLLLLNNLGAMLNLHGAEHKAVPLLQYCLQKLPNSSIVLNNIGQSFMGLGDLFKAAAYFNQCLSIDSLNIEANHSMGMLHYFKKEYDAAMTYFEREMSVAMRRSTMAMAYKMGRKFNLRAIMQRKQRRSGRPQKNHFEEITLGKFSFPNLPGTISQIIADKKAFTTYTASVQTEFMTWNNYGNQVAVKYTPDMGDRYPGLYHDLVKAMLRELNEEFTPQYLNVFTAYDHQQMKEIVTENLKKLNQLKCPEAPFGSGVDTREAYEIKCCRELKLPVADKLVSELSSFVQPLMRKGEGRWKAYINQLVEIVQLDPSPVNQSTVYHAAAGYFNFLSLGMLYFSAGDVQSSVSKCFEPYDDKALDSLVESDRAWKVNCPAWLNAEIDFDGMVMKMDCNKYTFEAGGSFMGAFEHEFKSGKSTLLLGPAAKASFLGLTVESKTQLYISFDDNKQFADFGLKNTAEFGLTGTPIPYGPRIKLGGNLAGIEASGTYSIINGYRQDTELKGAATLFPKDNSN